MKKQIRHRLVFCGLILGILALGITIVARFGLYRCPVRWTLGIQCPGCGMTTAAAALLRLDFTGAFYAHPLIYPTVFLALFLMMAWVLGKKNWLRSKALWVAVCGLFLGFWGIRIILFFQGRNPGFLERDALLPNIFALINRH